MASFSNCSQQVLVHAAIIYVIKGAIELEVLCQMQSIAPLQELQNLRGNVEKYKKGAP